VAAGAFDGALYATATAHHGAHDDAVLAGVELRPGRHVLDLGCGVGDRPLSRNNDGSGSAGPDVTSPTPTNAPAPATVALGASGTRIFPLCLGGNVFGWTADEQASRDVLDAFAAAGGTLVDTADVYSAWVEGHTGGESEGVLGRWLADTGARETVLVATKTGMLRGADLSRASVHTALDASLQRLGLDAVELYYAHRDEPSRPVAEIVETFAATVTDGRARGWAVSNWPAERIDAAVAAARDAGLPAPVAVQNEGSAVVRTDPAVVAAAEGGELLQLPYSTLASGFLSGKYRRGGDLPDTPRAAKVSGTLMTDAGWAVLDAVTSVAQARGVAVAAVALAWLRTQGAVPIASARSVEQLADLLTGAALELTAAEARAITDAGA
jgi:aryl-alcohol dehydrogenase (NADP+)